MGEGEGQGCGEIEDRVCTVDLFVEYCTSLLPTSDPQIFEATSTICGEHVAGAHSMKLLQPCLEHVPGANYMSPTKQRSDTCVVTDGHSASTLRTTLQDC